MIENESILCFAPDPWTAIWRNRHHLLTILAERNRVMYVEPRPYLRQTLAQWRDAVMLRYSEASRAPTRDSSEYLRVTICPGRASQVRPNLYVYRDPPYAPISGRFPLRQLTAAVRRRLLRRELRRLGFGRPILWLCRPEMGDLIGQFDEKLVLYHVVDEYSAYRDIANRQALLRRERAILERADLVLTTVPALWESKRPFNPNTHLVPNAVDYERFAAVVDAGEPALADLAALPRPLAGYVGAINAKLDLGWLDHLAAALPAWSLPLVGPIDVPASEPALAALRGRPNVHFLGQQPVEQVPRYINGLDVCLLPYQRNEWTRNISSLKLYEYLACGKPVVCSDVPAARQHADLVEIAGDADEFVQLTQRALGGSSAELIGRRRALAAQNTWRQRVEQISGLIEATLCRT